MPVGEERNVVVTGKIRGMVPDGQVELPIRAGGKGHIGDLYGEGEGLGEDLVVVHPVKIDPHLAGVDPGSGSGRNFHLQKQLENPPGRGTGSSGVKERIGFIDLVVV